MAKSNKEVFEVDGKKYAILKPSSKQNEDATMEYNRIFSKALQNGALLRERLDIFMREQGLWNDEKQKRYIDCIAEINEKEKSLQVGGIKLSEAKEVAFDMKSARAELQSLISNRNGLDVNTAQGQAENARFNYLLSRCLVYNDTGKQVYSDVDEYQAAPDNPVSIAGAEIFANQYFGLDRNYEKNLPENKFLTQYKFTDDEGRLINDEGKLVDYSGKSVDETGRYIDENGDFIDLDGNRVDENGEYLVESKPFLNDEGKEIGEDGEILTKEEEATKKKRGRPKKKEPVEAEASED